MDPLVWGIIGITLMICCLFLGVPMPATFGTLGVVGMMVVRGWDSTLGMLSVVSWKNVANWEWTVIPLFQMMGIVIFVVGIGEEIFYALRQWMGHFAGGIAASTSAACAIIGTMAGSGFATTALTSKVAYPEMRKYNYQPALSLAVCAASSTVAQMIPPSILLVVYAVLAEASIGRTLMAGVIPGFLSMAIYMIMIFIRVRLNPNLGPPLPAASWRERFVSLRYLVPAGIMMLTIIGGIYFGIFTATEAAGMGALMIYIIAAGLKRLSWEKIKRVIFETLQLSVMILAMLLAARGFYTRFLNLTQVTRAFAELALGFPSPWITVFMMFAIMFLLGMFIGGPLAYVTIPLFAPIINQLGFPMVWFLITIMKMTETGFITPPVCMGVFIAQHIIREVPMADAYKAVWWFVLCDMVTLGLFIAFPKIVTWLPDTMWGSASL